MLCLRGQRSPISSFPPRSRGTPERENEGERQRCEAHACGRAGKKGEHERAQEVEGRWERKHGNLFLERKWPRHTSSAWRFEVEGGGRGAILTEVICD